MHMPDSCIMRSYFRLLGVVVTLIYIHVVVVAALMMLPCRSGLATNLEQAVVSCR